MNGTGKSGLTALGPVMQLAYVPEDLDNTIQYWTQVMGVGPFFLLENIQADVTRYKGKEIKFSFSAAISYWGDMQIELIKQHDDTETIFSTWRNSGRHGLHHTMIAVDDMPAAIKYAEGCGAKVLQESEFRGGSAKVCYLDSGGGDGSIVELWQGDEERKAFFNRIHEEASSWDGSSPLRSPQTLVVNDRSL